MEVLANLLRDQKQIVRFNCSDIAAITGFHPYADITEVFLKYLYQDLHLLYELDCQELNVEIVTIDQQIQQVIQQLDIATQGLLNEILDKKVHDEKELKSNQRVKTLIQEVKTIIKESKKEKEVSVDDMIMIEKEIQSKISKQYGIVNENQALDTYAQLTGFEVTERNSDYYIYDIYDPVIISKYATDNTSSSVNTVEMKAPANVLFNTTLSSHQTTAELTEEIDVIEYTTTTTTKTSVSSTSAMIKIIDNEDEQDDDDEQETEASKKKSKKNNFYTTNNVFKTMMSNSTKTNLSICTTNKRKRKPNPSSKCTTTNNILQQLNASSVSSTTNVTNSVIEKNILNQENPLFKLIGKVDGISYQLDTTSDDPSHWQEVKVIIEVKNRVNHIKPVPQLYDMIQVVAYMQMLSCQYADIVQVKSEEEHLKVQVEDTVTSMTVNSIHCNVAIDYDTFHRLQLTPSTYGIHRVSLHSSPYFHSHHWQTTIIPRLIVFRDAIYTVRHDHSLRRYYLLLATDQQKKEFIVQLCPYFTLS